MSPIVEQYRALARYNTWMNRQLYALSAELSDEERRRDLGAFFRSVHGTLNHLLLADRAWMLRFTGDMERFTSRDASGGVIAVRALNQELYADFEELRRERERTDRDIEEWTVGLDGAAVERTIKYGATAGEFEHVLWWAVSHMFNHQTHHRGQLTTLLNQLGKDPGVTDLAVFLRSGEP
jgi:uncharacterized damage-inducible protein DinB